MVETIKAKWSENTGNRKALNEDVISSGIVANSLVNSDELNSVVARQDEMLDDLQRGSAWNIGKEYKIGDMIFLNVNYKRASDVLGKNFKVYLVSLKDNNTQEPFQNNSGLAISFAKNYDYAVTQFIIQANNDETPLKNFVNSEFWQIVDATANDLTNAVRLNVSNESKLGTLGSDSSIITFNKDLNINSDIITHANFNINKNLNANRMTTNNNMKFNNAFCNTPLRSAKGNEIINAKWADEHTNGKSFIYDVDSRLNTLPSPLYCFVKKYYRMEFYDMMLMNEEIPLTKDVIYPDTDQLYQFAIYFPQDYILDYFSYMSFYISFARIYIIMSGITVGTALKYFRNSYRNNHKLVFNSYPPEISRELAVARQMYNDWNNWLAVDFSKDFEISMFEYVGLQNSLNYRSIFEVDYTSYFMVDNYLTLGVLKENKIVKNLDVIIKWEKDKRRLSFSHSLKREHPTLLLGLYLHDFCIYLK